MRRKSQKSRQRIIPEVAEPKNNLAMQIAQEQVEDIDWRPMTKKIQLVVEHRVVDGLKRETDKSIDITNKLNNLASSLRSRS